MSKLNEQLIIKYKDEHFILNETLLDRQDAWDNLDKIKKAHHKRIDLFEKAKNSSNYKELQQLPKDLEKIEFELQEAWKFPRDATKHTWWYKIPQCTCPKMDNADPIYAGRRIISGDCPVHSLKYYKNEINH